MIQAASADPGRPRRLLEEVLARPEFHGKEPAQANWLERLLREIFGAAEALPDWIGAVVLGAMVVLAGWLIVQFLTEGSGFRRRARAAAAEEDTATENVSAPARLLFGEGRRALEGGNLSEAVVLLFRSMVARLTERGLLLADPSRTNREHLRDLRSRPAESRALRAVVPLFERVRYGEQPAGADEAAGALSAAAALFPEEPA